MRFLDYIKRPSHVLVLCFILGFVIAGFAIHEPIMWGASLGVVTLFLLASYIRTRNP